MIIPEVKINEFEELIIINKDLENNINTLYIKETVRNFIKLTSEEIYIYGNDKDEQLVCVDYKSAWGIDADELVGISKEYNIDFKIYAFERGMEFNQDIEIIKGEIIKDNKIEFVNYIWDCINPEIGG